MQVLIHLSIDVESEDVAEAEQSVRDSLYRHNILQR